MRKDCAPEPFVAFAIRRHPPVFAAVKATVAFFGLGAFAFFSRYLPLPVARADTPPSSTLLWSENFSRTIDWTDPEKHRPAELSRVYSIAREGPLSFLHAHHDGAERSPAKAMHYGKVFADGAIPLERTVAFRWRWRARVQPSVSDDPWLDMAAGIYVVMKTPSLFSSGRGFKFGWLAKPGPTGTSQRGLLQVPMRTEPPSDRWRSESVDLCKLYRRTFGPCEGEQVVYVGVTTDGDGTKSIAEGDYADFELRGAP
jgi:hypothetical protein